MIVLGCLGKFGALFVSIPDPVIGGMFMVMFGTFIDFFTRNDRLAHYLFFSLTFEMMLTNLDISL